jgi:hypothetical protein
VLVLLAFLPGPTPRLRFYIVALMLFPDTTFTTSQSATPSVSVGGPRVGFDLGDCE